jgi:hypothetical protein
MKGEKNVPARLARFDRIDVYRSHLFHGTELNPTQREMLARYRQAHAALCHGYSRRHVVKLLMEEHALSEPQAYAILTDAVSVYGKVGELQRDELVSIHYEMLLEVAQLARKQENLTVMVSALDKAGKLHDLYNSKQQGIDPKKWAKPTGVEFTDAVEVLIEAQKAGEDEESELEGAEDVE